MGAKVVNLRRKRPVALVAFASRSRSPEKSASVSPYVMVIIASSFGKVFYINADCHYSNSIKALDRSRDSWVS